MKKRFPIQKVKESFLPKSLVDSYSFNKLYEHRPDDRSKVLIYDKNKKEHIEKTIYRSYNSFLKTPEFDKTIEKSYMFLNKSDNLPDDFKPFLEFAKTLDSRYNQMVVNWYEPEDYIEFHRDCTAHMLSKDSPILCINLNETNKHFYNCRSLLINHIDSGKIEARQLLSDSYYIINDNNSIRHAVTTGSEKRISITFRMMRE